MGPRKSRDRASGGVLKTGAPAADTRGGEGTGGADMDFGQFNLMGYRVPGTPAHRLYDEAVEQRGRL